MTWLIKVGGGKEIRWDYIAEDLKRLTENDRVILVHGASGTRKEIAAKLGVPVRLVKSPSGITSVYTDVAALEVFLMVYAGLINKQIVACLQKHGINAVGLSGIDGRLWEGKQKPNLLSVENEKTKLLTGNLTGKVERVNTKLLELLLDNGYTPVLCPPAISYEGEIINTDNDRAIAVLAQALGIKQILLLFEAPGLLQDPEDKASLIPQIRKEELGEYQRYARGQMTKKVLGAEEAFKAGAEKIYWGDGRIERPIFRLLEGEGTVLQ